MRLTSLEIERSRRQTEYDSLQTRLDSISQRLEALSSERDSINSRLRIVGIDPPSEQIPSPKSADNIHFQY